MTVRFGMEAGFRGEASVGEKSRNADLQAASSEDEAPESSVAVLVDAGAFRAALRVDLREARDHAFIQSYSFEGDRIGAALTDSLLASPARDRRLLIDSYTRINQADRWIHRPSTLFDAAYRRKLRRTRELVRRLGQGGCAVRFGCPVGFLGRTALRRDHKKLVLFDDRIAYIGGINFSAHNFAWHDLMVRIEDAEVARFLRRDFARSWEGRGQAAAGSFPHLDLDLYATSGPHSPEVFGRLRALIDSARSSIDVISPYLGPPFVGWLGGAARRGVRVRVVTPRVHNKRYIQRYLLSEAARYGFEAWMYPDRMIHMKCMLIDDEILVAGSCNYDLLSYHGYLAEVMGVFRAPAVVRQFRERALIPDLAKSERAESGPPGLARRTIDRAPVGLGILPARILRPRSAEPMARRFTTDGNSASEEKSAREGKSSSEEKSAREKRSNGG